MKDTTAAHLWIYRSYFGKAQPKTVFTLRNATYDLSPIHPIRKQHRDRLIDGKIRQPVVIGAPGGPARLSRVPLVAANARAHRN